MSRSYKKSKVYNIFAGHESDKEDKVRTHKKFRRTTKYKMKIDADLPNRLSEVDDIWDYSSEGVNIYDDNIDPKIFKKMNTAKKYNLYDSRGQLICSFLTYQRVSAYKMAYGNSGWYIR